MENKADGDMRGRHSAVCSHLVKKFGFIFLLLITTHKMIIEYVTPL
jgi:hypothetical protein